MVKAFTREWREFAKRTPEERISSRKTGPLISKLDSTAPFRENFLSISMKYVSIEFHFRCFVVSLRCTAIKPSYRLRHVTCLLTESIYKVPGDDTKFYGTFTTSTNGLMGSAICSFTLDDIQSAFSGKFKEQASSSSAWLPVLTSRVPEPRPGTCVNDTETLPDTVLNFIRSHPLMDSAVMHDYEKPVFFKRDVFFTRLVVDKIKVDIGGAVLDYTVYYAGTSKLTLV